MVFPAVVDIPDHSCHLLHFDLSGPSSLTGVYSMVGVLKALQLSFLKKCLHGRRFWKKKVPLPKKGEGGTGPEQKAVSQKHAGRMSFNLCLCQMSLGINLTQQLSLGS
jgi:hypothetical protein